VVPTDLPSSCEKNQLRVVLHHVPRQQDQEFRSAVGGAIKECVSKVKGVVVGTVVTAGVIRHSNTCSYPLEEKSLHY
jgi:hypothetical protein